MSPTNCVALTSQYRKLYNVTHKLCGTDLSTGNCTSPTNCVALTSQHRKLYITHKLCGTDLTAQETVHHPQTVWLWPFSRGKLKHHPQTTWHWPQTTQHREIVNGHPQTVWHWPYSWGKLQCHPQTMWHWPRSTGKLYTVTHKLCGL